MTSSMYNDIYIIGAGGHLRSLLNLIDLKKYCVRGIFDETYTEGSEEMISDIKIIGNIEQISPTYSLVLSVGDNNKRANYFNKFKAQILTENIVHPTALIEKHTTIRNSNFIHAYSYINSQANIGFNNILNTRCIIEHECVIGNNNHISVCSILCGRVQIGNNCFIGAGAVIRDKIKICDNVTIGINSVVAKDINEPGTYVGSPVRRIK